MDEVDSIGSARTDNSGGSGDSEVQRTMLELLNQLDGFEATNKIKVRAVPGQWVGQQLRWVSSWDAPTGPLDNGTLCRAAIKQAAVPPLHPVMAATAAECVSVDMCAVGNIAPAGADGHQPHRHSRPRAAAPRPHRPQDWCAGAGQSASGRPPV